MTNGYKKIIKDILPPAAVRIIQSLRGGKYGWFGDYRTWAEARNDSSGYDSQVILERTKDALLKVRNGEAVYERDSVLFDKVQYSWPLLTSLLWIASHENNVLNVVDFGGSLGSTYYQNIKFLAHLRELKWSIVEQQNFVECGKNYFENDHIKYYRTLEECIKSRRPVAILLSSVIQYLERPYDFLAEVMGKRFLYILFDRTSFLERGDDRVTVQKVSPDIYPASYPAWFFNLDKFLEFFASDYELIAEFDSFEPYRIENASAQNKGFVFLKKAGV